MNILSVAVNSYATRLVARNFVDIPGRSTAIVSRKGRTYSNTFDNGLRIDPSSVSWTTETGTGSNVGQDSFDDVISKDNTRPTKDNRTPTSTDPFLDAPTSDVTEDGINGFDSFDFALDNLSGVYGDLNL